MELNDFIKSFAEQFDDTDANEIKSDTKFKELDEWTSLIALSVISMIDEEYGVSVDAEDIRGSETVEDLFNSMKAKA